MTSATTWLIGSQQKLHTRHISNYTHLQGSWRLNEFWNYQNQSLEGHISLVCGSHSDYSLNTPQPPITTLLTRMRFISARCEQRHFWCSNSQSSSSFLLLSSCTKWATYNPHPLRPSTPDNVESSGVFRVYPIPSPLPLYVYCILEHIRYAINVYPAYHYTNNVQCSSLIQL